MLDVLGVFSIAILALSLWTIDTISILLLKFSIIIFAIRFLSIRDWRLIIYYLKVHKIQLRNKFFETYYFPIWYVVIIIVEYRSFVSFEVISIRTCHISSNLLEFVIASINSIKQENFLALYFV